MDKRFLGILGGLAIIFVGFFIFTQNSNSDKSSSGNASKGSGPATEHVIGAEKPVIALVEYGDYQCPICGLYYQPLKDALTPEMLKKVKFQFANLPLTQLHPNAFAASRAAEAAGLQGKYWEMHDKLYEMQSSWSDSTNALSLYQGYAKDLGLNLDQFNREYPSSNVNDAINNDMKAFDATGQQQSTPSFFVNGKYVENSKLTEGSQTGAPTKESITAFLEKEIEAASKNQ